MSGSIVVVVRLGRVSKVDGLAGLSSWMVHEGVWFITACRSADDSESATCRLLWFVREMGF